MIKNDGIAKKALVCSCQILGCSSFKSCISNQCLRAAAPVYEIILQGSFNNLIFILAYCWRRFTRPGARSVSPTGRVGGEWLWHL